MCLWEIYKSINERCWYQSSLLFSLNGYSCQLGLENTDFRLQTLQDNILNLLLENNIRGGISSVTDDRYVKSDEARKLLYIVANIMFGHSMSQAIPCDEIEVDKKANF